MNAWRNGTHGVLETEANGVIFSSKAKVFTKTFPYSAVSGPVQVTFISTELPYLAKSMQFVSDQQ